MVYQYVHPTMKNLV